MSAAAGRRSEQQVQMDGLRRLIRSAMDRHGLVGAAVAVVRPGGVVTTLCEGHVDIALADPVTPDTVFEIASITKALTATGLLGLLEQGRFKLDDPVNDYLRLFVLRPRHPDWPVITFRHLLTHTSGLGELPRVTDVIRPGAMGVVRSGRPIPRLTDIYGSTICSEVPAGTKWAYSNHGFAVLGQLIEDISGQPLRHYMIEHVFDRLGMTHSDYQVSERISNRLAAGHRVRRGQASRTPEFSFPLLGAGGAYASIADMGRYLQALLNGGQNETGAVLSPTTIQLMWQPHYCPDERLPAMGLAFQLDRLGSHRTVGKDGNHPGFSSSLLFAPDDITGVAVLTNTRSTMGAELLAKALLGSLLGVPDRATQLSHLTAVDDHDVTLQLCGIYRPKRGLLTNVRVWQLLGGEVEVVMRDGGPVLKALSPISAFRHGVRLYPVDSHDHLAFEIAIEDLVVPVVFTRDGSGRIATMATGGIMWTVLRKRPSFTSYRLWARTALMVGAGALALGASRAYIRRRLRARPR